VAPPSPVPQQPQVQAQQQQAEHAGGSPVQGEEGMDVDLISPRKRAAAAALERAAAAGASPTSAAFMAQLQENMQVGGREALEVGQRQCEGACLQSCLCAAASIPSSNCIFQGIKRLTNARSPPGLQRRHQERQAGGAPHPLAASGAGKRHRGGSAPNSPNAAPGPAAAAAAAAAEEPDPRLCLWEPPVSPYGLLGELSSAACSACLGMAAQQSSKLRTLHLAAQPPAPYCGELALSRTALRPTPTTVPQRRSCTTTRGSCWWPACC
jgi:hypothetical protein